MRFSFSLFSFLFFSVQAIFGQQSEVIPDSASGKYDIFNNDNTLICSLTFDIKKFRKDKLKDKYQDATFSYYSDEGVEFGTAIKLKARGVSRLEFCHFPPVKLKFQDKDNQPSIFNNIKTLKLVTHCKSPDDFEQYLFKEYIVYKLYNVLMDKSFRVKLIHITYNDKNEKINPITKYGFFIEEPKKLAARNNSFFVKDKNLGVRYIEPECMMTLSLFQYMIGNPDWSITGLHNIKLLKSKNIDELLPYAVPYDFDNTGMVNTPYAQPPEHSGIASVRERKFEGICKNKKDYKVIISKFNNKKQSFLSIIENFDLLENESKEEMKDYLDSFYILLNSQEFYKDHILPFCKQ